ncbi:MAG TPA: sugar ABC transporter permease [bacterium]|nr:sugar ABC transporter permease [bacterium]
MAQAVGAPSLAGARRAGSRQAAIRTAIAYLFLAPALVLLVVFTFYPVVFGTALSLFDYNVISPPRYVGFTQFAALWQDRYFWTALRNSAIYLAVVPVLQLSAIVVALWVRRPLRGIAWFRVAYYVPVVTSIVVVGLMWRWLYDEAGLLNYVLLWLGVIHGPIHWLSDPGLALYSVMAVTWWKGIGYYMVIYLAGLEAIPSYYDEAAALDGAGPAAKLFYVTIPLLRPSILLASTISILAALRVFEEIYVMTGGGPIFSTYTIFYYMFDQAFNSLHLGYAAAIGVVLAAITAVFSAINFRLMRHGGLSYY